MRITETQRVAITDSVKDVLGEAAVVRLFGSRADDAKRGGDIDLYIETDGNSFDLQKKASLIYAKICLKLGDELPIDIIIKGRDSHALPIHSDGIKGLRL